MSLNSDLSIRRKAAELCAQSYSDNSVVEFGNMEVMFFHWKGHNFLIWRGSEEGSDWITNIIFWTKKIKGVGKFHRGFMKNILEHHRAISELVPREFIGHPLVVAGHSKGGAEAQLFLVLNRDAVTQCVTFGSPKPIKKIYNDDVEELIRDKSTHYINPYDSVTKLPPRSKALGKEVIKRIKQKGLFKIEHLMTLYLKFFD